jgi:hypothetical protein
MQKWICSRSCVASKHTRRVASTAPAKPTLVASLSPGSSRETRGHLRLLAAQRAACGPTSPSARPQASSQARCQRIDKATETKGRASGPPLNRTHPGWGQRQWIHLHNTITNSPQGGKSLRPQVSLACRLCALYERAPAATRRECARPTAGCLMGRCARPRASSRIRPGAREERACMCGGMCSAMQRTSPGPRKSDKATSDGRSHPPISC